MRGKSRTEAMNEFLSEYERWENASNAPPANSPTNHPPPQQSQQRASVVIPAGGVPGVGGGAGGGAHAASSANAAAMNANVGTRRGSALAIQGVIKEGTLYKQRDVFKGWRPRRFVLQEGFLHYYYEQDDVSPRRSMDIAGCKVSAEKSGKFGENDQELFPFVISHIKASKVYTLAADSKEEADDWIAKISTAAQASEGRASGYAAGGHTSILESSAAAGAPSSKFSAFRPEIALANVPPRFLSKLERAVAALVESVDPTAPNWEPMFEKQGIIAKKRAGDVVCVRGDGNVPFSLPDVLSIITNAEGLVDVDAQLQSARMVKAYSSSTFVHQYKYKGVWPASPRDCVCLCHWRLLADSRVVFLAFSEKLDELCPVEDNNVRAELILGGYVLTPVSATETLVQYVVQIDMKLNMATNVLNLMSNSQAMNVFNIKKKLQTTMQNSRSLYAGRKFTFEDLLDATGITGEGGASVATSSASSAPAASSTPAHAPTPAAAAPAPAAHAAPASSSHSTSSGSSSSRSGGGGAGIFQNVKSALSGHKRGSSKAKTAKISTLSLCVLFLPSLAHYIVGK
jgi:hypothetical protein